MADAPSPSRRARLGPAERRASIVAAATAVFSELGYQRATMAEVARRIGVTEPVVFQNFGSKAAVFAAVVDAAVGEVTATIRGRAGSSPTVASWLDHLLSPRHLRRAHARGSLGVLFVDAMALTGEPVVRQAVRRAHRAVAAALAEVLAAGQAEGGVRPDLDPDAGAWWLLSFLAAERMRSAAMPDRRRLEPALGAMAREALTRPA